ncbi:MAG: Bug family tripartite tricarboxylate transporter substrate binding protein [Cognatishimia sp.]
MKKTFKGLGVVLSAALAFGAISAPNAQASDVSFEGKTLEFWVPFGTGGGTDRFARMFQPFLTKYLPGNPDIAVLNKPGGASVTGSNEFAAKAPADGTVFMAASVSTLANYVLGVKEVKYNPSEWNSIIAISANAGFYANKRATGVKGEDFDADLQALKSRPIVFGMQKPQSADIRNYLALRALGYDIRPILGLKNSEQIQGIIRGEIDVSSDTVVVYQKHKPYFDDGTLAPLFTYGVGSDMTPDPMLPGMPTLLDAYKSLHGGAMPEGTWWDATSAIIQLNGRAAKSLNLPAGTSDDIIAVFTDAIEKTIADPEFRELAKVELAGAVSIGEAANEAVAASTVISEEAQAWIKQMLSDDFGIN